MRLTISSKMATRKDRVKNDLDDLRDGVQVVNCAKDSHVQLSDQRKRFILLVNIN